ncbi:hypothetical protein LINGRAHAP2_LOCUS25843 [Linum grandiflorum]
MGRTSVRRGRRRMHLASEVLLLHLLPPRVPLRSSPRRPHERPPP